MKKLILVVPIGTALILSSCYSSKDDIIALQKEIIKTKKEVYSLKKGQRDIKVKLNKLSSRVDSISQMASQNALEIQKIKTKLNELEKKGISSSTPAERTSYQTSTAEDTSQLTDKELYKQALEEYAKQNYQSARRLLALLIKNYPYSKYYDNALFWIGQTYYMEGDYEKAIQFFDKIIKECEAGTAPDCNKLPMAMLKKAYALVNMGNIAEARKVLNDLILQFPDSDVVDLAKRKLEAINSGQ
jgi:tol-pal system protein YbgF